MCNHRLAVFTLRGAPIRHVGRYGERPGEFRHPVGVAISADLVLVSEQSGRRVQVLAPSGACLQVVASPFRGACPGAIGAYDRRVTVTDADGYLHGFVIQRRGLEPMQELADDASADSSGHGAADSAAPIGTVSTARGHGQHTHARPVAPSAEGPQAGTPGSAALGGRLGDGVPHSRAGRWALAQEAADFRGVLEAFEWDDVTALMPIAHRHAAIHPELYPPLQPPKSGAAITKEFDLHLAGRAPTLGPP